MRGIEAHELEELCDTLAPGRSIAEAVDDERLFDDVPARASAG
jgi:hypothetical protein